MEYTPENITSLSFNEIFVFGSNLGGRHGAGAAKQAMNFGAKYGVGFGMCGSTFALPTKNASLQTLPLANIKEGIWELERLAKARPELTFLVTKIGCGLAGYEVNEIAPLFRGCYKLNNVVLPVEFSRCIEQFLWREGE